ncbi:MAG TPA: hypothetical protein VEK11_08235 [Thermoanaerobaculia bacterium]|jgi:hypothetical protein|nr:hypothetical protein [Thermoanaerobaculia bacterium]
MKRFSIALLALLFIAATEKWWDAYDRGVNAVNAKNYKVAQEALAKSIGEMPMEGTNVRAGRSLITYLPHFWLGIAKFNLGDTEGALREWRISEEQGVIARTEYYARMKDWVARAKQEQQRDARSNASVPRKAADAAISRALEMQLGALSAGGDRSESYLSATRKLQEARTQFQKAGTDVNAFKTAEQTAQQAASLFSAAAEEGKKQKAARAAAPPPVVAKKQPVVAQPQPAPVRVVEAPPPAPVITEAEAVKAITQQEEKRVEPAPPVTTAIAAGQKSVDLRPAYRAFAKGDLTRSEQLLNSILSTQATAEAFLLRGCARYTRAMLSRTPDPLLLAATDDFRAALQRDRSLRLDKSAFSPKLVTFFEQVRSKR